VDLCTKSYDTLLLRNRAKCKYDDDLMFALFDVRYILFRMSSDYGIMAKNSYRQGRNDGYSMTAAGRSLTISPHCCCICTVYHIKC